jgi:hypothetical protein
MLEEPSDKARNDDPRAPQSLPTFAQDEPHRLDLGKLELVQRWSQYAAVLVLVIFIVLFVAGSIMLNNLYARILSGQQTLDKQTEEIKGNDLKIKSQEEKINIRDTTIQALLDPNAKPLDAKQADQVRQIVESNIDQSGGEKKIAARIYIQIGDEDQRARATEAVQVLQKSGYIVPGIENVGSKANIPSRSQLRYYQTDSVAQADTKDIISTLRGINIPIELAPPLTSRNVRPRHYELWFGKDF